MPLSKNIIILASVAMMLIAMCTGNAFATKHWYSGTVASTFNSGNNAQFTSTIKQDISPVYRKDVLAWGNIWYNNYPGTSVTPGAQYGGFPNGGASGGSSTYSSISYGKYYPGGDNPLQSQEIDSTVLDTASGSYSEGINHQYNNGGINYATGYNMDMTFSV
ncbi:hypothetical protein Mtc_0716 [Methanocella conradii HZ254]|uniref:Uncharacterized protein n=2 Tax=Methanocella TaxID=570266 RepID=H8I8K4_METCZ|nr:hypothetical protein Mtc_0716 [Methanocella conradii HZ254]